MADAKKLIIVESPTKAKTIEKFLGKGYKVIASQGHIRDLPKSQLGVDPQSDFAMKYITIRGRGNILADIRKEAKNAPKVLLATDPDREGEAISWHLAAVLGIDPQSACRVEFHEITKSAVKDAIKHPRAIDMDRVNAQQARRALDRLVGYKISPLLWAKVKKGLSAGRVQSVATRMVVEREKEIDGFIPEEYWDISADFEALNAKGRKITCKATLHTINGKKAALHNSKQTEKARDLILQDTFSVKNIKDSKKLKKPQPPFTTSSLQQEAGRKLGFTTAKTMQVVQQLYEGIEVKNYGTVGLVTYIRTDSVRVSQEAVNTVRQAIENRFGENYCPKKPNEYKGRSNAQDAHEAIRPTMVQCVPEEIKAELTRDQYQLYRLIYARFMASQMTPAVFSCCTADIAGSHASMRYYGEHMTFDGYRVLYTEGSDEEEERKESVLPQFTADQKITFFNVAGNQHFTQPPPHYTEASLVKALEEKGIGRPSTYAPTITTIISRNYVSREKKKLYPTELGQMISNMMVEHFAPIVDEGFTASFENRLDTVEAGQTEWRQILRDFYPPFEAMLQEAETKIEKVEMKDEVSDVPCDLCGAMMVYKMSRYGRFLACPNFPECRNTKTVIQYIDADCPKCGKRLMEKVSKKNRKFYGCEGYPDCDFVSWDMPLNEKCPKCGSYMVRKYGKHGEFISLCANETCRYKITREDNPSETEE